MSNFSLMDAIECGVVKLPRVPVAENDDEAQRNLDARLRPQHLVVELVATSHGFPSSMPKSSLARERRSQAEFEGRRLMEYWVGVTDNTWFEFLSREAPLCMRRPFPFKGNLFVIFGEPDIDLLPGVSRVYREFS